MTLNEFITLLDLAVGSLRRFRILPDSEVLMRFHAKISVSLCIALSLWSDYCGIDINEIKRLRSYELVKLWLVWIRQLDALIDTPEGRQAYISSPTSTKANRVLRDITSEIVCWVFRSELPRDRQRMLLSYMTKLRHQVLFGALRDMLSAQLYSGQDLRILTQQIEQTSGMMYQSFAGILNRVHVVPPEVGDRIEQLFRFWMVAVQVADDLLDFPLDYKSGDVNFLTAALKSNPDEERRLDAFLSTGQKLTSQWIPRNAPKSHTQVLALGQEYLMRVQSFDSSSSGVERIVASTRAALYLATDLLPLTNALIWIMGIWNRLVAR
jgi:hypothetical protein